jgi:hypothetical protein
LSYWNDRYLQGGKSGKGSVGKYRKWKWKVIEREIGVPASVIDVGCGDLSFWKWKKHGKYIGIDLSQNIIAKDSLKWRDANFICDNAAHPYQIRANTVFCLDVLFHVMDDKEYDKILDNLMMYAEEYIVIYNWWANPLYPNTRDNYQCYRDFSPYAFYICQKGFEEVLMEKVPYDNFGALWIFRRKNNGN